MLPFIENRVVTPLCVATDNGVSLPIVFFVLSGIVWAYNKGLL